MLGAVLYGPEIVLYVSKGGRVCAWRVRMCAARRCQTAVRQR